MQALWLRPSCCFVHAADKPTEVDARVLPQPMLAYGNPPAFDVGTKGAW